MKKYFPLIVLLLMGVCKVSAQVDFNEQIQQQVQKEVDKRMSEVNPLLHQTPIQDIQPKLVIDILNPPNTVPTPLQLQATSMERLFAGLTKAKLNSSIRRNFLFEMVEIGLRYQDRIAISLNASGMCVAKVPANAERRPSVVFLAHTDVRAIKGDAKERLRVHKNNKGESIELNKDVVISRIDTSASKPTDPYKGMPITIFSSDGDMAIGMDALCGSTVLLSLLKNVISSDMQHGDIYFCVFERRSRMNSYLWLQDIDSVAAGGGTPRVMVFLNGQESASYASNIIDKKGTCRIMEKSLSDAKLEWKISPLCQELEQLPFPVISLYCGIHNPGRLNEWACLEDMMDAVRLGQSIVANVGKMAQKKKQ